VKLKITVDGKTYEVEVEAVSPEIPQAPLDYGVQPGAVRVGAAPVLSTPDPVKEEKVCRSPISGIVVKVPVQRGQSIQPGDILIVLEAMKMETNITAPIVGKITNITVAAGDAVQSGQLLVEFE